MGLDDLGDRLARYECDMVELDVMPRSGELVVAHSARDLQKPGLVTFDAALAALRDHLPAATGLLVDLKGIGFEQEVVDALRFHDQADRALISTMELPSLPVIREIAPEIRLGWSVPKARRDYLANPVTKPLSYLAMAVYRQVLPRRAIREICRGYVDAIMAHWGVVTSRLCNDVHAAGGEVYAWTVDDGARLRALQKLGVSGVITNDLELFDRAATAAD